VRVQLNPRTIAPTRQSESGAVAIVVAGMAVLIFVLAAFVVDYGVAFTTKRHLQSGADAAALAGARTVQDKAGLKDTCAVIEAGTVGTDAENDALANLTANKATGGASGSQSVAVTCEDDRPVVEVQNGRTKSTSFAGIFGVEQIPVGARARAVVGPAGSAIGLRPFGICKDIADTIRDNPAVSHTVAIDNTDVGCGYASGNWAMMDMNDGGNASVEAKGWIEDGYEKPIEIDEVTGVVINGDTGTPSPGGYEAPMNSILGEESILPVYSHINTPTGNNADFVITSFIGVKLCGWKFNGQSGSTTCFSSSGSMPKSYIQLRFARVIAVGELSKWCRLGDPTCDRGVRVIKMID
jgi:hypothetical protein